MDKKKTVIITGLAGPYLGELDEELGEGFELWSCNMGYTMQKGITRLFIFDQPEHWLPSKDKRAAFFKDVNELGFDVYFQDVHPEIEKSIRFPVERLLKRFGIAYFTSTMTWQLALALDEGFERIVLHKIHCDEACYEYFHQKSALDFWLGMAAGMGVEIIMSEDSLLCKPHPWHSGLYGYEHKIEGDVMAHALSSIIQQLRKVSPKATDGSSMADEVREMFELAKNHGMVKWYEPIKKPREDCILPTHLTHAEKLAQTKMAVVDKKAKAFLAAARKRDGLKARV